SAGRDVSPVAPLKLYGAVRKATELEITHRVHGRAADANLEVHVRPEAVARAANGADYLTLRHRLAHVHADRGLVSVAGGDPAAVLDAGVVAVAAHPPSDRD